MPMDAFELINQTFEVDNEILVKPIKRVVSLLVMVMFKPHQVSVQHQQVMMPSVLTKQDKMVSVKEQLAERIVVLLHVQMQSILQQLIRIAMFSKKECVITGKGCTSTKGLCSTYKGTSETCVGYIGSDGYCKGVSDKEAACSPQVCKDADIKHR